VIKKNEREERRKDGKGGNVDVIFRYLKRNGMLRFVVTNIEKFIGLIRKRKRKRESLGVIHCPRTHAIS
jgi:hypothetical protein